MTSNITFENETNYEKLSEISFIKGILIADLIILSILLLVASVIIYLWRILISEIRSQYNNYRFYHQVATLVLKKKKKL